MNREIEFRGKNSANEWLYGYLTKQVGNDCYIIEGNDYLGGVIEETIGQYTGLKDKNGIKIYEGDVLEFEFDDIGKQKAVVYFNDKYAMFGLKPLGNFVYATINEGVVVGNIYDTNIKELK